MNSEDHADAVEEIIDALRERILGPGAEQYDNGTGVQRFEERLVSDIVKDAVEEIDDLIVYLSQLRIRFTAYLGKLTHPSAWPPSSPSR